jgi:DNA segregation ATPase FtsK/SpoIIIE, S-DNA-T family
MIRTSGRTGELPKQDTDAGGFARTPLQGACARMLGIVHDLSTKTFERTTAAQRARQEGLDAIASRFKIEREHLEAAYQNALTSEREAIGALQGELQARLAEALANADKTRKMEWSTAQERGDRDIQQARAKLEEALWFVQTSADSDKARLDSQAKADASALASRGGDVARVRTAGQMLLEKWGADPAVLATEAAATAAPAASVSDDPAELKRIEALRDESAGEFGQAVKDAEASLRKMEAWFTPRLTSGLMPWGIMAVLAAVFAAGAFAITRQVGLGVFIAAGAAFVIGGAGMWLLGRKVRQAGDSMASELASKLALAQGALTREGVLIDQLDQQRRGAAKARADAEQRSSMAKCQATKDRVDHRLKEIRQRVEEAHEAARSDAQRQHAQKLAKTSADSEQKLRTITREHQERLASLEATMRQEQDRIEQVFLTEKTQISEHCQALGESFETSQQQLATLQPEQGDVPAPQDEAINAAGIGVMEIAIEPDARTALRQAGLLASCGSLLAGERAISCVLPLELAGRASLLVTASPDERAAAVDLLNGAMLAWLRALPPGRARFTLIDPVGLGESFAGFMRLSDFATSGGPLVGPRAWTEARHIEQRLTDLTEHMETVIQKFLRDQYPTLEAYNQIAGQVAEPYRFVVLPDVPMGLSELAATRLSAILASGARCGVHVLAAVTRKEGLANVQGLKLADFQRASVQLARKDGAWIWQPPTELAVGPARVVRGVKVPSPERLGEMLDGIGKAAVDESRVRVPFTHVAPDDKRVFSLDSSEGLSIPLGRAGATKLQDLRLGEGTKQHVLIAGRTGSGKSTLMHVLVTAAAAWYDPTQLELYLVDFKKGVEFKTYATHHLPHARVIAVESDREFGLSVLRRLDEELSSRGEAFRKAGVQSLAEYRKARPELKSPRVLLVVDEFQELFVEDDKIAQQASLLLDRLVRQGRAFGMHVILGSQTLAGAFSIARSTMGQMGVRIALQCSEADSYLILGDDNPAARLLARPGEAIYNDASGLLEGNSLFQVCYIDEDVRARQLQVVANRAKDAGIRTPAAIVFEGNAPADPAGPELAELIEQRRDSSSSTVVRVPLGLPVTIKGPTVLEFSRQGGSNGLLVGNNDDSALAMVVTGVVSALAINPMLKVLMMAPALDQPRFFERLTEAKQRFGDRLEMVDPRHAEKMLARLTEEISQRQTGSISGASQLLVLPGAHRLRGLHRKEDDFSFGAEEAAPTADKLMAKIVIEGPEQGIHTLMWIDGASAFERLFKRAMLNQFDDKVLMQVSAADSSALIDSTAASTLGPERAVLVQMQRGYSERFRPFEMPMSGFVAGAWGG